MMAQIKADGVAVYVYRRSGERVEFLQVRRSAQTGEYQHSWQTVYGGIEAGETAVQAAVRELAEETGLRPRAMVQVEYLESFYFQHTDHVTVMPVFAVEVAADDAITLNDEHDAWRWVDSAALETHFMWQTQLEALRIALAEIQRPGMARRFLAIDVTKLRPPELGH